MLQSRERTGSLCICLEIFENEQVEIVEKAKLDFES